MYKNESSATCQTSAIGVNAASQLIGTSETELGRISRRVWEATHRVRNTGADLEALADRLHGAPPPNISQTGDSPSPYGALAEVHYALDGLADAITAMEAATARSIGLA